MDDPQPGDFTAWIVGAPGPDVDYALCTARDGDKALLRFQVWQQPGPWHEKWAIVASAHLGGCWKTQRLDDIGPALHAERSRLFPTGPKEMTHESSRLRYPLTRWSAGTALTAPRRTRLR